MRRWGLPPAVGRFPGVPARWEGMRKHSSSHSPAHRVKVSSESVPPGTPKLFAFHSSLFSCLQGIGLLPCPSCTPLLFFSKREEEERRARCRRRRGFGANEDGPVLLQDSLTLCGKRVQVWCRLECPLLLFPLPLAWCARKTSETCTLVLRPVGVGSKAGAEAPGLGRFKGKGFLREGGNRNRVPQKRCFCGSPVIKKAPGGVNPPFAEIFAAQKCS